MSSLIPPISCPCVSSFLCRTTRAPRAEGNGVLDLTHSFQTNLLFVRIETFIKFVVNMPVDVHIDTIACREVVGGWIVEKQHLIPFLICSRFSSMFSTVGVISSKLL